MASLLTDPLLEISGRGPPPDTTFYHFSVSRSEVIWRWWKISMRAVDRSSRPGEVRASHLELLDDTWLQSQIGMVFGRRILVYTKALCQGHYNYLEHLSDSLLLRIINYLELEDVGRLGRTSRRFRQICESEEFWEQAVRQNCNTVAHEVVSLALEVGWRSIFFTNKLQLQKLISRRRLKAERQQEGRVSDPDEEAGGKPPDESSTKTDQTLSSEEESHAGTVPDLSLGTGNGTGFDTSSCCDVDPDPNHEPEAGSDSRESVPEQHWEDIKHRGVKTLEQSNRLRDGIGDCSEPEPNTELSLLLNVE